MSLFSFIKSIMREDSPFSKSDFTEAAQEISFVDMDNDEHELLHIK